MNVLAVITLVLGVIGGVGIAPLVGVIALIQIRRTGQRGRALAVIGIILGLVWTALLGVVVYVAVSGSAARDAAGTVIEQGSMLVQDVRAGDCVQHWGAVTTVGTVTVVPCARSHDAEVISTFPLQGTAFPGDQQITTQATTRCLASAGSTLTSAARARVRVAYVKPLEASWGQGDHIVACVAVSTSGPLTGSLRG
jgi:Septum formation/Domain of unknown function (DUF4190)